MYPSVRWSNGNRGAVSHRGRPRHFSRLPTSTQRFYSKWRLRKQHRSGRVGKRQKVTFALADEDGHRGRGVQLRRQISWDTIMSELEKLEDHIEKLSPEELKKFRAWFAEFDARAWDAQIEVDSKAGKLDALVAEVLAEHKAGKTREL